MAKVTDYSRISETISELAPNVAPDLVDYIGSDAVVWCVMGIYLMNDRTSGYGQDISLISNNVADSDKRKISIISFANGVSVIIGNKGSRYQDNVSLCGYEDLHDDIYAILMYIETAIVRIILS